MRSVNETDKQETFKVGNYEKSIKISQSKEQSHNKQSKQNDRKELFNFGGIGQIMKLGGVCDPFDLSSDDALDQNIEHLQGNVETNNSYDVLANYRQRISNCAGFDREMEEYNVGEGELELGFDDFDGHELNLQKDVINAGSRLDGFLKKKHIEQLETQNILLNSDDEAEKFKKTSKISGPFDKSNNNIILNTSRKISNNPSRLITKSNKKKRTTGNSKRNIDTVVGANLQSPVKKQRTLDFYSPSKKPLLDDDFLSQFQDQSSNTDDDKLSKNIKIKSNALTKEHFFRSVSLSGNSEMTQETQLINKPMLSEENRNLKLEIIVSPEASLGIETREEKEITRLQQIEQKNDDNNEDDYESLIIGEIIRSENEDDAEENTTERFDYSKEKETSQNNSIKSNEQEKKSKVVLGYYEHCLAWFPAFVNIDCLESNKNIVVLTSLVGDSRWECQITELLLFDFKIGNKVTHGNKSYTILDKKYQKSDVENTPSFTDESGDTHVLLGAEQFKSTKWVSLENLSLTTKDFIENEASGLPSVKYLEKPKINTKEQIKLYEAPSSHKKDNILKGFVFSFSGLPDLLSKHYIQKVVEHGGKYLGEEIYDLLYETNQEFGLSFSKSEQKNDLYKKNEDNDKISTNANIIAEEESTNIGTNNRRRSPRKKKSVNYKTDISSNSSESFYEKEYVVQSIEHEDTTERLNMFTDNNFAIPVLLIDNDDFTIDKTTPKVIQYLCLSWPILHISFVDYLIGRNERIFDYIHDKDHTKSFIDKCSAMNTILHKYECKLLNNGIRMDRDILRFVLTVCDIENFKINKLLHTTQDLLRYEAHRCSFPFENTSKTTQNKQYNWLISVSKRLMKIPKKEKAITIDTLKDILLTNNSLYA